jgi:hypothetical protein
LRKVRAFYQGLRVEKLFSAFDANSAETTAK